MFKNLTWFYLASLSLLFSGFLQNNSDDLIEYLLLIWVNLSGVFLVYRFNECMGQKHELNGNLKHYLSYKLHRIVFIQLLIILLPLSIFYLDAFKISILTIGAFLSFLYSVELPIGNNGFKLKNVFVLKNILIGVVWGSLILIGAGSNYDFWVYLIFIFVCIQVFIGGIVRDIPDQKSDDQEGVKSLPVVLGADRTIIILHSINLISGSVFIFFNNNIEGYLLFGLTSLWRMINLIFIQKDPQNALWTQQLNLFTCVLLFLILLFLRVYGPI